MDKKKINWQLLASLLLLAGAATGFSQTMNTNHTETATFGGGCFWCMEAEFQRIPGVKHVTSGFAGGHTANPSYEDVCTGDHACIRLSGCPSLSVKHTDDPLKDDPVAAIDNNCVGCGNCGEVSEAAVLCPSFYRADIIHNPNRFDRLVAGLRRAVIGFLQRRREAGRVVFAD